MKKIVRYFEYLKLKYRLKKLDKTKKILILQLASGLGDYIWARKYLYDHINKGLRKEFNIIVIGTRRWKDFATYYDSDIADIFIYISGPFGEILKKRYKLIKLLPEADVYIDIIVTLGNTYVLSNYIKYKTKYYITDYKELNSLKINNECIYDEGYEWLFNNLSTYYQHTGMHIIYDIWKQDKKGKIDNIVYKHINNGYIIIFSEGFSRGSFSEIQIKSIIDYLIKNTTKDIILCGILKTRKEVEKLIEVYNKTNRVYNYYKVIRTYEIPKLIQNSSMLITTDTAPYHFGIQLDVKILCITNKDMCSLFNKKENVYNLIVEKEKLEEIPVEKIIYSLEIFI